MIGLGRSIAASTQSIAGTVHAKSKVATGILVWLALASLSLAGLSLGMAGAAQAFPFTITTSGVITSGTDSTNILGVGTNLANDSYQLSLFYSGLGPGYFTDGIGGFAADFGDNIIGSITVTVNGHTLVTPLLANTAVSLLEDTSDVIDSNSGNDAAGNFASGSQDVTSVNNFVSYADLQTDVFYALQAGDTGLDIYSFSNAANTAGLSFSGVPMEISLEVPEPASLTLLTVGILGLRMVGRRRRV